MCMYKVLNSIFNPNMNGLYFLGIIVKIATLFILNKEKRIKRYTEIKTKLFGYQVYKKAKEIGEGFYCGGWSNVTKNTILKEHVCFNGMRMEGDGKVIIGKYFHSGTECLIITRNHDYDTGKLIPYDSEHHIYKDIEIADFVWLGSRVMILPGTKIGEGAIIQGGSVVHGEIPPYAIAGGNPAKIFKYRNIEHFEKLKKEKNFY